MTWWLGKNGIIKEGVTIFNVDIKGHSEWMKDIADNDDMHRLSKAAARAELGATLDVRFRFHEMPLVAWAGDGGFFAHRGIVSVERLAYFANRARYFFEQWRKRRSSKHRDTLGLRMIATFDPQLVVDQMPGFWSGDVLSWAIKNEREIVGAEDRLIVSSHLIDAWKKRKIWKSHAPSFESLKRNVKDKAETVWALRSKSEQDLYAAYQRGGGGRVRAKL